MIEFLVLFPVALFILNLWLRLFENIFSLEQKNNFFYIAIFIGLVSGLSIISYPHIIDFLNLGEFNFVNKSSIENYDIFVYWLWLSAVAILTKLLVNKGKLSFFFLKIFLIFSILFLVGWHFWKEFLVEYMLIYYIFVAFWEEFIKFILAITAYEKFRIIKTDIIIFSLMSAIGFAFVENIFYMIWWAEEESWILAWLGAWIAVLISRWVIWFLAHIIFTWNIWLFTSIWIQKDKIFWFVFSWILLWVVLHYGYNVLIYQGFGIVIPFLILIGYFWLSWLFYMSDRLYITNKEVI